MASSEEIRFAIDIPLGGSALEADDVEPFSEWFF